MRRKKYGDVIDPTIHVGYELLKNREAINYAVAAHENESKAIRRSYTETYTELNKKRANAVNTLIKSDNPEEVSLGKRLQAMWKMQPDNDKLDDTKAALVDVLSGGINADLTLSVLSHIDGLGLNKLITPDNTLSYLSRLNSVQADSGVGALQRLSKYEDHINNYLKVLDAEMKIKYLEQQEAVLNDQAIKTSDPKMKQSYLKRLYQVRDSIYAQVDVLNAYQKDVDILEKADPTSAGALIDNTRKAIEDFFNPLWETTPLRDVLNDAKAPLYDLKSKSDAEKRNALQQSLRNIADIKPLLQANVDRNLKDAAYYERRISPEFVAKRDTPGMDFFDADTYLYKMSGVMGSSGTSWRAQFAAAVIGAAGGFAASFTGGASVAAAAPIVFGLNYAAGIDENQAEVATAAREKFTAMLGGENNPKYKQFIKDGRAQLPKNISVPDSRIVDMYLTGQIVSNKSDINRAKVDTHKGIEALFAKDMVATTANNLIYTALEVMPFGKSVSETIGLKNWRFYKRASAIPRYLRKKGGLAKETYEIGSALKAGVKTGFKLFSPLGFGGMTIGAGIGGATNTAFRYIGIPFRDPGFKKLLGSITDKLHRVVNAVDRVNIKWLKKFNAKPAKGILGDRFIEMNYFQNRNYVLELAKRLGIAGVSEGVEEGKQYQNAEDFKKGYDERQLRTDVISLAFDDFLTGLDVGRDVLSIPLDPIGILKTKDKDRLAEIKGGMLAGLTHLGSIGIMNSVGPYLEEKSANKFLIENMLTENVIANDKLDKLMHYSNSSREQSGTWDKIKAGIKQGIARSNRLQAIEKAFANFKKLNQKEYENTGDYITSPENIDKEFADFRRAVGLTRSTRMQEMAERAGVDTNSDDYGAFVATYMMAVDNLLDKSKQFAKNESERDAEANKILNSISIINEQDGAEHDLKRPFVELLARLQALLETKQELEDALKAGANRASMRRYIDGIERQIDIVKNGQYQTDPETGEQVRVGGLSDFAQRLYSAKVGVDDKGYNLHVGESINTLDDIAAVSVDQEAQDKLADIYRQSYLEQFNIENASAALEQITGTTKIVKDENGEDKVVVDKPSGFNTIWDRIKEVRNDNDVFWNELTSDAFKTDEELEADKDAGEVYESGWSKLQNITTEYALDAKGNRIKADENTKLKDDQTVSQDGYVLNITKKSPIKERLIFTPADQDEVSKSGEYQETVESIAPEVKIAYGYENSSDIGLVTQQVGEAKQQLLEAKESEKRAKEAARLRAELKRKLEKEVDEKRKAFIKSNPKYEGKPKDQVDAAIAKHEKKVQRRKQREQERKAKDLAKQIEKNKLTKVDGKVHVDKKGISHKVYQRKDGTYVTVHWDKIGNLRQTVIHKSDILSENQALINDAYTELVKLIKQFDGHDGDVMRMILSKIQISDLSEKGVLNTYTQLYKLLKVAGKANSVDIYEAVGVLGDKLASTGYVWNRTMSDDDIIKNDDIENEYVENDKLRIGEQRLKSLDAPIIYHNGKIVSNPTATVERGMSLADAIKKAKSGDKTIAAKLVEYKNYLSENLGAAVADVQYPGDAKAAQLIEKIDHELDELNKSPEQKKIDKIVADKGLTKTDDVYTYKDGRQTPVYLDKNGKKCILSKSKKGYRVNYTVKFDQKPTTKPEPAQPAQPTKPTEPSKSEQPTQPTQPTSTKPADKPVTTDKTTLSPQQQTVQMLAKKRAEDKLKVGVDGYELTGQAYFIKVDGKIQRFRRVHATIPAQTLNLKESIDHMINTFEQIYNKPMSDEEVVQEVVSIIEDVIKNGAYVKLERDRWSNSHVTIVDFEKQPGLERHPLSAQAVHDLNIYLKYLKDAGPFDPAEFFGIVSDVAHVIASTEPGTSVHVGNVVEGVVNYVVQRVLDQGYESIVGTEEQLVDEILNTRSHDSFKQSSTPESGEYGSNRTYDEWFNKNRGVVKNLVLDVLRQLKSFHDLGWVVQSEKLTLYGEFKGVGRVAGEPDLIAIDQDGGIHMIDIKTSTKSFYDSEDYSSRYVDVYGADTWGQRFSTQTQYSNQQTAYRMLMKASLGLDTTAELMPYVVDYNYGTGLISNVVLEPRIPIVYSDFIEAMFNGVEYSPENFSTMSRFSERFVQGVLDTYNTAIENYNKAVSEFESQVGQLPKQFMFDLSLGEYMTPAQYTLDEIHIIDAKAKRLWDITQQIHYRIEQALVEEERKTNEQPTQPAPEPTKQEPEVAPESDTTPENKTQSEIKPSTDKKPEVKPANSSTEPTGLIKLQNGYVYKFSVSFENPYPQIQSDRAENDKEFAAIINAADFGLPETTIATISNTGKNLDKIQIKITYIDRKTGKEYNFGKTLPNGKRDYLFLNAGNNLPGHAVTENFKALYNLAAQLTEYNQTHPGKKAVLRVTEWYRTDGRLIYKEKNGVVSQESHPVVDPKLGIITDDLYRFSAERQVPGDTRVMLNDIGFVKDGVVYTYGDSNTRQQLDVVPKDIPNGVIVYSKRIPRAEAPNGFNRLPIVLRKRALSDGDVNFIMDVLKDPSLLSQEYNGLHGATIGSISNLILPIITDAAYLSPQKKLFVDRATNTVYYITAKEWKDAENGVGTLSGYNMSNENHVEELKQIIKGLSIEVNSDVMQSRFGTDTDSNLPLKAIREWFNDNPTEKTFTVRGSLGNTSISFDRSDFQDHKTDNGDVYNGLSGAGWYLRTGILQTNAVGIGAPHVHINAVTMDTKGYSKTVLNNGAVIDNNTESKPETKSDTKPESKTDRDSKKKPPKPSPTSGGQKSDSALDALQSLLDTQDSNQATPANANIDNQSADQQVLDNEQIEDWELFHIGRVSTGKTINKKRARRHAEHILGKDFVSDDRTFGFIDGVIKQFDDGSAVLGVCRKDSIRLSSLAENGVEYHEAFHRIFELIIPEHLRDSIYEKVAADNDIDLQNDPDYTNHRKVAELMADWYWDYQVGQFHIDSYNIFAKAWNRMRDFALRFTNRYRNDRAVLKLFSDIRRGKYASRKANSSAIKRFVTNFKNNLMYKQHGKDFKHIVGDEMYYHIVESAKFFVFAGSDISVNSSNISDLNNALNEETILKGAKRLADAGNDILGINLSDDQRSEGQKALFEFIANLDDIQFKLDLANSIKSISTNFEQVESEKADDDANAGDTYSINQSIEGHIKDAVEFDPFEKTSQQVRFFFATIPNQKWSYTPSIQNGKVKLVRIKEQVFNEYGLPEFIPVRDAYNKFINTVHNVDTLDELIDTLNKKAQIEPFYETIAENIKAVMDKRMSYDGDSVKYDIDAENLLVQIMAQARSNKYNMVTMMSSSAEEGVDTTFGKYKTRVMPTGVEYQARNTAISWSSNFANGGTNLVKITKVGKRAINDKDADAASTFSNFAKFLTGTYDNKRLSLKDFIQNAILGKLGLKQYLGLPVGDKIFKIQDIDDVSMQLCKEYIVQQLNSMGINIELNAFNYMLVEKYGSAGAEALLKMLTSTNVEDSMTTFIQFLNNIVVNNQLNVTDDNKFYVGSLPVALDLIYTKFAFTSNLANWQYRYKQATTQLSVKGSGDNLKYLMSQNNFLTDSTRDFNKRGPQFQLISSGADPYIYSTRTDPNTGQSIWAGSFVLHSMLNNSQASIELQSLDGFRTDNKGDYGADYFQMTNDEDILSKIRFLMDNSLIFQTLSDKKSYFAVHLKGFRIPGIDYSRMYDNSGKVVVDGNALGDQVTNGSCSYDIAGFGTPVLMQRQDVIDQLLSYAYAERESIIKTIDAMSEMTDDEKKKAVKNFYSSQNGAKFSSLLGIWPMTESGVRSYLSFNNEKLTPKKALERADENFFAPTAGNKPMTERAANDYRRTLIELNLQRRLDVMMENLQHRGLIAKDSDGYLVNKGLPADAIEFIAKSLLRKQNKLDATGNAIDQNTMRMAIHTAIGLFANDMMVKSIMSVQETERIYAANPAYFKWKYDENTGELSDRTVDELKRAGGFVSTGINNFMELTNIPQHWLDKDGQFTGEYRCCEIKDEEVASPQIEDIKTLMTTSARVQALREHYLKQQKSDYEERILKMKRDERPNEDEQLYERERIAQDVENKLATMSDDSVKRELKSLGMLDIIDKKSKAAYNSYTGGIDVNDGAAYITDDMCEMLLRMVGSYSSEVAEAFKILRSTSVKDMRQIADAYTKVITTVIGTQKYTAYGRRQDSTGNIVDYYHKYALFPIFPMLATGKLGNIYNMMKTNNTDMVLISSAVKVGSQGAVANPKWDDYRQDDDKDNKANYNKDGSLKPLFSESFKVNPYSVSFEYLRKQLNTDPNEKKYMNIGTQTTKIALTNLNLHAQYLTRSGEVRSGQQIHDDIMQSMNALSNIGRDQLRSQYFLTNDKGQFVDENGNVVDKPVVDPVKYQSALKRILGSDKISLNLAQALQLVPYKDGKGKTRYRLNMPLDAVQSSNFLESKIISSINKSVIDTKTPGAAFIQRSVWGMEGSTLYDSRKGNIVGDDDIAPSINGGNSLQMVNEEGSMDCVLSVDFFTKILGDLFHYTTGGDYILDRFGERIPVTRIYKGKTLYKVKSADMFNEGKFVETWVDDIDNLPDGTEVLYKKNKTEHHTRSFDEVRQYLIDQGMIGPKAKANILAYRIPTQAQSSIHALRCVDILPVVNDTVMLPAEFTRITGSDFDIDKLYLTALNYHNRKDGGVSDVYDEGTEKYYQNKIVDAYLALLTDRADENSKPRSFISLHRSIDNDTQLAFDALNEIGTTDSTKTEQPYQFYDLTTQTSVKNSYITGKIGIGPFALNNNNHILTWLYHVSFKPTKSSIMTQFGLNNLDNMTDVDGDSIMGWLSAFINGHVDIAKDAWVSRCNVNPFTYNLTNLLLRTGWGKNTIFFLRQPIMMAMADAYMNASSEYMSDGTSKFRRQQQAIDDVVFGEDSKYHLENVVVSGSTVAQWLEVFESNDPEIAQLKKGLNEDLKKILTRENMLAQAKTSLGKMGDIQFQAAVYLAYKQFDKYANALSNLVKYCKIDTKKQGKSVAEQLVWYEGYNDLFNNGETGALFNRASLLKLRDESYVGVKTENAINATKHIIGGQFFSGSHQFIKAIENLSKLVGNEHRYETVSFVEAATKAISASIKSEYFNYYVNKLFGDSTYVRDLVNGSSEQHNVRYHYDKRAPYIEVDEDMIYPLRTYIGKPINISWKTKSGSQMKAYPNVIVAISGNKVYLQKEIQFNSKGRRSPLTVDADIDVQFTQGNNTIYDRIGALKTLIENNSALADLKGNILLRDIILAATQKYTPSHKRIAGEASDTYDDLKFIKIETFFEDNGDKTDQYIRAWDSLLRYTNDNERLQNAVRKLANDLVVYAFITSGDTKGSTKLFQYVPDSWRNGEFNPEGVTSYAEFIRNKLDELNGYGETKIDLDDVILNNWQNDQFVPRYRIDDNAEQQKLTPIYTDGRNTYGYPVVIQGMNIEKPADKNHMPKVNVVIDPTNAPQYIKITRDYKHRNSQRQYSIYKFHSVAQTADGIRYPIYVKVEPKGITIKSSGGTYMVTEYGRSDRLDKAENSTIPELFELLYTAQNFQDQLRGMPKSDLRDSNILQDLRRFAELDMAEKMVISRRSYSANMDIAQTQAVQFDDTVNNQSITSDNTSTVNTTQTNDKPVNIYFDNGQNSITISTGYTKGEPEDNPNTDYVFTENAEAALAVSSRGHGLDKSGIFDQEEFPFKGSVKLNVSDVHQTNSAAVRTDAKGNITQNAYGIVVKKYQHDANGKFVAQPGCFEDTDEDFKKFKSINNIVFKDIEQSKNTNIVFPSQIALGRAALPLRFAAWLHNQLEQRFGLQTNIERSKKASYEGYGLRVIGVGTKTNTSVDTNSQSSIEDSTDINSNGFMSDISKARSIYTDGSVTPPAQITPDTVDNVGNTYKENIETLESDKTILSNEEILRLRPFTGNDKAPRIAVASEHTDPVFFAKKIKDFFDGKTSVQPRFGKPITAKDIDALYIITKHDGLPLRDILSIKIPKIIHFSITGLGGTKYEPGVMPYNELLDRIGDYIKQGLDPSMVTVRIDPIVPGVTSKHVIEDIIKRASSMGIKNIRFSIMDFYATTAQFTEANGFDYSKYYVPQTNADGSQRVLLVSRDGRSFSRIDGVSYRQVGKSIAVLQSYGAESKVYLQGKSGNVWVKTVQTSNITDDVIKSKDGWTVLNDEQVINDQVASRVKAGVHLQKLYETHAKKTTIENIANIVKDLGDKYGVRLSTCAEPDILPSGTSHEGCLSVQAINDILHTNIEDKHRDNNKSRPLCECYGGKTDILKYNDKCASSCAYCYAHHNSNAAATMYNPDGSLKHNALTTTRRDTEEFDDTDIDEKFILHCKGK